MKSQVEISQLLFLIMEIIIIIVGSVALYKLIGGWWQPYRAVSFANAELLRSTIDDVCASGGQRTINFDLPQPEPSTFEGLTAAANIFPKIFIKAAGDPYYVLYYEAFPPGEAVAWEFNADLDRRAIVPFTTAGSAPLQNAAEELGVMKERLKRNPSIADADIIFPNIVLEDSKSETTGNNALPEEGVGKWSSDGSIYAFTNYMFLGSMQKTEIKYRACGKDSLCLKTKEGVYRLPLPSCAGKIEMIQIAFTHTGSDGYQLLQSEAADFNLFSPCKGSLEIKYDTCTCSDKTTSGLLSTTTKRVSYELYSYDTQENTIQSLNKIHESCWHRIGGVVSDENNQQVPCIKITLSKSDPDNLCSGNNANMGGAVGFDIEAVRDSTSYDEAGNVPVAVMKDSKTAIKDLKIESGTGIWSYVWAWP